ncbi:hypothetical protein GCM10007173_30280 [Glutamicibacter ardleyensis]|uniref:Uncharacterized protein n=1 Tax=Glutamicibacter ardleyensis TaxID=225894 RepID=A0ABQ2DRV7_9MICC|nr:hypothetical protein GCM10007173_30280 [Glutamicibacter ardleyensis]
MAEENSEPPDPATPAGIEVTNRTIGTKTVLVSQVRKFFAQRTNKWDKRLLHLC